MHIKKSTKLLQIIADKKRREKITETKDRKMKYVIAHATLKERSANRTKQNNKHIHTKD